MIGEGSKFELVRFDGPDDPRLKQLREEMRGHGVPSEKEHWIVVDDETANTRSDQELPSKQNFGGANGGEYRMSFHGYAPGFVQVIESPTEFQITPMQIDTFHREKMNLTGPTKFVPGPLPRNSLAPTEGPDAIYSGLLECPVTTRVQRVLDSTHVLVGNTGSKAASSAGADPCGKNLASITSSAACFAAAAEVMGKGSTFDKTSKNDPTRPPGCSVTSDSATPGLVHVLFNTHNATTTALGSSTRTPSCGEGATRVNGMASSLVTLSVDVDGMNDKVTISITGPSDVWFGVGFNAQAMKDAPWAVIVEPTEGMSATGSSVDVKVSEYKLSDQGTNNVLLESSVTLQSSSVTAKGLRTVVLTRALKGLTKNHYSFGVQDAHNEHFPFINALGSGPKFSYHKQHAPAFLAAVPVGNDSGNSTGDCVCSDSGGTSFGQGKGKFVYVPTSQKEDTGSGTTSFNNVCPPSPRGDLLYQKNPTCDARTYVGGQITCHHMWSLLDADQDIPWPDQPVEYRLKFRFWVQPWNASYHTNVNRVTWGIASPVEYDIPQCKEGMPGCSRNPVDGTWQHTITGTYNGTGKLVAAHFHCHAPACLSVAMYRCPRSLVASGQVCDAGTGELLCEERPVYGGHGDSPERFDEPGFILQPPCLWGDARFGLEDPPDTDPEKWVLHTVKTSNATYGHHGEMAWQQMYVV
eukprot:g4075.t1